MKLTTVLYRLARSVRTVDALASVNPKRISRRVKNIAVGRTLAKLGIFKRLWK